MATWSVSAPSLILRSRVYGVETAAFSSSSSSSLVRLHQLRLRSVVRITPRRGHGAAVLVSPPRCQQQHLEDSAALETESLIKSIWALVLDLVHSYYKYKLKGFTRERFSIVAISVCAPLEETREKLAIAESEWCRANKELCRLDHIQEAAILSTPSRLEVYVIAPRQHQDGVVSQVTDWISKSTGVPVSEICVHRAVLYDNDAIEHLFKSSAGMVYGESQILLRARESCWDGIQRVKTIILNRLFHDAYFVCNWVKTNLRAGVCESSAAMELATRWSCGRLPMAAARFLVVEPNDYTLLVIQLLVARGCNKITIVTSSDWTKSRIEEVASGVEITCKPFSDLCNCVSEADIVFTTTTFPLSLESSPMITVRDILQKPLGRRLYIDIGSSSTSLSCIAGTETATARAYTTDDLVHILEESAANRDYRLIKAGPFIHQALMIFISILDMYTIEGLRAMVEGHRHAWVLKKLDGDITKLDADITRPERKQIEADSRVWVNKRLTDMLDGLSPRLQRGYSYFSVLSDHLNIKDVGFMSL